MNDGNDPVLPGCSRALATWTESALIYKLHVLCLTLDRHDAGDSLEIWKLIPFNLLDSTWVYQTHMLNMIIDHPLQCHPMSLTRVPSQYPSLFLIECRIIKAKSALLGWVRLIKVYPGPPISRRRLPPESSVNVLTMNMEYGEEASTGKIGMLIKWIASSAHTGRIIPD